MRNRAIRELYGRWKFNADLMTCQECGYSVIASRMHEEAHHAAGCKNSGDHNPWLQLTDMLHELNGGTSSKAIEELRDEIARLRTQRDYLLSAASRTLDENAHLADGDVCTLIVLKRAVETLVATKAHN